MLLHFAPVILDELQGRFSFVGWIVKRRGARIYNKVEGVLYHLIIMSGILWVTIWGGFR